MDERAQLEAFDFSLIPGHRSSDPSSGSRHVFVAWMILMCVAVSAGLLIPPPIGLPLSGVVMVVAAFMSLAMQRKVRRYRALERVAQAREEPG